MGKDKGWISYINMYATVRQCSMDKDAEPEIVGPDILANLNSEAQVKALFAQRTAYRGIKVYEMANYEDYFNTMQDVFGEAKHFYVWNGTKWLYATPNYESDRQIYGLGHVSVKEKIDGLHDLREAIAYNAFVRKVSDFINQTLPIKDNPWVATTMGLGEKIIFRLARPVAENESFATLVRFNKKNLQINVEAPAVIAKKSDIVERALGRLETAFS